MSTRAIIEERGRLAFSIGIVFAVKLNAQYLFFHKKKSNIYVIIRETPAYRTAVSFIVAIVVMFGVFKKMKAYHSIKKLVCCSIFIL